MFEEESMQKYHILLKIRGTALPFTHKSAVFCNLPCLERKLFRPGFEINHLSRARKNQLQ